MTNIKIRISHKGDTRYLSTKFYIVPEEWVVGQVSEKNINAAFINLELKKILVNYEAKLLNLNLDKLPIRRIVELLSVKSNVSDFTAYFEKFIDEKATDNYRTSEIYTATLNKIQKFDKRNPLMFEDINAGWLMKFKQSMVREGLKPNTKSIALRTIRAVINHAINNDVIPLNNYPFKRFNIRKETADPDNESDSEMKYLTIDQIKEIRDFKADFPILALARDTFMLSFYLIGINNDDLYHLESVTGNGRIQYTRAKTHRKYSIRLEPEARELITKLKGKKSLLCYSETYETTHAMTHSINKALKKIIPGLTMYSARRTWGTIAYNECSASMDQIAQALGHKNKTIKEVTEGYVKKKPEITDDLNRQVLDCLIKKPEPEIVPDKVKKPKKKPMVS